MKQQQHLFTNKMLRALLVPIIMEQLLNALMGTVDTMMVSNVGSAAISGKFPQALFPLFSYKQSRNRFYNTWVVQKL